PPASEDLGCQRDDLGELPFPQLPGHRPEDAGPHRVLVGLDEHDGIAIEADVGAVAAPDLLDRPHDHRPRDLALLHRAVWRRLLDRDHHGVAEGGVALVGAAHHPDALDALGPGVVGDVEHGARLDHAWATRLSTWRMRQRFSLDIGRVSSMSTRSPTWLALSSSCAFSFLDMRMTRW